MNAPREQDWAERWDRLYDALAAEPRREVLRSLTNVPEERRLPLPDAATSPNQSIDTETLRIDLRHHHLPKLADVGYVRWESEPFCVQRGPRFEEPAFVVNTLLDAVDEIPPGLVDNCRILQEMTE
ncbi:hypothetical protein [Halobacterium litoreum]|uniref:ArsR family transcriptional regulator n=1 Tax=Halobacterium litoreum TaxID=2039234 RepID=A0ABD5NGI1_9EURY|nr:hypothetical protein [Halobacterium litoreum]UHH12870.1 hypothetical protein LT972_11965 [Halobacterium litoreum]